MKGFTLIELAIVLVVIGLLVSLGVGLLIPLTKRAKYIETKEIVNAAADSVISYASANNFIPTKSQFSGVVRNPNDAWTKSLLYIPSTYLAGSATAGGVCGRRTTEITVVGSSTSSPFTISNVAFIVISGSENYNIQTGTSTSNGGTVTVYEVDIDVDANPSDLGGARPEPYDDIVTWVTLDELRTKAGCQGRQLMIVNNELPYGFLNSSYGPVTIIANGGVGSSTYQWSRQQSASTGLTFVPNSLYPAFTTGTATAIYGTPTASGSYDYTFFVRDSDNNMAEKRFVLTINPKNKSACTGFTVFNRTGANRYYKMLPGGGCTAAISNGANITTTTGLLNAGEALSQHTTNGNCTNNIPNAQVTFDQAASVDEDGDCIIAISSSNTAIDD